MGNYRRSTSPSLFDLVMLLISILMQASHVPDETRTLVAAPRRPVIFLIGTLVVRRSRSRARRGQR